MPLGPSTQPRPLLLLDDHEPIRQLLEEVAGVRELRSVIERPSLVGEGHLLTEGDLSKSLAARRLGISRRALYRLIDKYAAAPSNQ